MSMVLRGNNLMLAGVDYTLDVILNTKMDVMLCVYICMLLSRSKDYSIEYIIRMSVRS